MYSEISQFEPLMPADSNELEALAFKLAESSARLEGRLSPLTLAGVAGLLRKVNSYYSNLIEGHNTHPIDIERAMKKDYFDDPGKRDLQIESLIHIDLQEKISERINRNPGLNIAAPEFICWIHNEFYERLPERMRSISDENGEKVWVDAGQLRKRQVAVGRHLPPSHESIETFMARFSGFYEASRRSNILNIVAIAASHHRLMWIHPFLDGNGRVTRLFTDAFFMRIGLAGYGLWNASRGLARSGDEYKQYLAAADEHRDNDLDGRGNLSNRALKEFCLFFLETCIDQAEYMNSMLVVSDFLDRIENYVERRRAGMIVDERGKKYSSLPDFSSRILQEAAVKGEISRGEIQKMSGKSEKTVRTITKILLAEGLLVSNPEWGKSSLRLGFPAGVATSYFPKLFPDERSGY